jgi:hypothetical protein
VRRCECMITSTWFSRGEGDRCNTCKLDSGIFCFSRKHVLLLAPCFYILGEVSLRRATCCSHCEVSGIHVLHGYEAIRL